MSNTIKTLLTLVVGVVLGVIAAMVYPTGSDDSAGSSSSEVSGGGQGSTLASVKGNDYLTCGVGQGVPGFSSPDSNNNWTGIDVDYCRALAAAVLGDADKVRFTPLSAKARFAALNSNEIDVLSRNTTWTLSRDSELGIDFVGVTYYDGQGFMVKKSMGVGSALELSGASICVNSGTTTELNVSDYFRQNGLDFELVSFEDSNEVLAAYQEGRCDVYTTDRSGVASERTKLPNPDDHIVLPEVISKEPLGPAVRHGDNQWGDIARWTLQAMIAAEEFGVTSANVDSMAGSSNIPEVRRLLGVEGDMGAKLGLDKDWARRIISSVGNYGEIYERNVGVNTPLKLTRGVNALWTDGGLQYAPPVR